MNNTISQNIVTSIDLGSNSFRVLKYDCISDQSLGEFDITVGTADGLSTTGNISDEALTRVVNAIKKSIKVIQYDPTKAVAVTTQALRIAKNSSEILASIEKQTGVKFTIIDGKKEGALTLLSLQNALKREKYKDDNFVLLDIGGGSSELILFQNNKSQIMSFPFGIVTLTQSLHKEDDFERFEKEILKFLKQSGVDISESLFMSTAGTPTIIAALKHGLTSTTYDKNIINGTTLSLEEINTIQKQLKNMPKEELISKVGIGREDFIHTGILIYSLFFKTLQKDLSIVFDDGLREGVALDACRV